ncbi:RagB/SusD family nutrient uptake outer membrane protein [Chitinophaga vietnamensis]|uniref:RagB/SusD family nutrient uptake outer membrane protein n=1 Tax=Chitinophaga vietnamensis TaxID=2593957 RepID=UPI001177B255|nr:RagB/SusD family nutrient uptake outer membrane protein [Chitinophaga vietnamensis]
MKRKFVYISALVLLATAPGCKKYLEQVPDQRTDVNSPSKVAELLTSAYPRANYIPFLEAMSDNAQDKGVAPNDIVNRESWKWNDVPYREEDSPDFYWQKAYAAIAAANEALRVIGEASDPASYAASKGEALLARAYAHFMLVTIYAKVYNPNTAASDPGIPYVTAPENVVTGKYERKTVKYVYDMIEKDLTEGLPLIDDNSYKGAPSYHFTRAAAHAFATRFYLFKKDYQQVVQHANLTFPSGNALPYLRPINSQEFQGLEPLVKRKVYTQATTKANLLLVETASLWARSLRSNAYGCDVNILQGVVWGNNSTGGLYGFMFYGTPETYFTPKFNELFIRTDINANIGNAYDMVPLLTAEEVLFNRAEANTELGNYDAAIADLNTYASQRMIIDQNAHNYYDPVAHKLTRDKITNFYGTVDLRAALINNILDFKRVEFLFEGLRWFDILRHKLPVTHNTRDNKTRMTLGPNDPRRVVQIPQEAQSSGLELNPR